MQFTPGYLFEIFKLWNITTESSVIELESGVRIENDARFTGTPKDFPNNWSGFDQGNPNFSLIGLRDRLIQSPIAIGVTYPAQLHEKDPFSAPDCSYVAMALALLSDHNLAVGIEAFNNGMGSGITSMGPWCSFFWGPNPGTFALTATSESRLKEFYVFVRDALRPQGDERLRKLLFFCFGAIVQPPSDNSLRVLKCGFPSVFNEVSEIIVNAALFFEHVFSEDSQDVRSGVQTWNAMYSVSLTYDDIELVMCARHCIVHDNATRAKAHLETYRVSAGLPDQFRLFQRIKDLAVASVKTVARAIATDVNAYRVFRSRL
jgi:hypothetical protein